MASTSIYDAFFGTIPLGLDRLQLVSDTTHESGEGTRASEPPTTGFSVPFDFWDQYADLILRNRTVNASLLTMRLASFESSRYLKVEADVGDAAAAQLLNPVDLALALHNPQRIRAMNQLTEKKRRWVARADKVWMRYSSSLDCWKHFAVLDYKRPETIKPTELRRACTDPKRLDRTLASLAGRSGFRGKSYTYLRQAVLYAFTYDTPYIAFFDWDALILIVMADLMPGKLIGGDFCYMSVITDKRLMRRALLGFLERAYQASVNGGERGMPPFRVMT